MATLLDDALDAGMLGMSGMDAAIDKLDGDRFRSRALPSTRDLAGAAQADQAAVQARPDPAERTVCRQAVVRADVLLASSRIFNLRKGVRMSLLVSAYAKLMPLAVYVFGPAIRLSNKLLRSSVRFHRGVRRRHRRAAPA